MNAHESQSSGLAVRERKTGTGDCVCGQLPRGGVTRIAVAALIDNRARDHLCYLFFDSGGHIDQGKPRCPHRAVV